MDKYIFHINPIDFIFSGTIFTGLLFVLLLMFTKRSDQAANRFLGLALAIVVLWMMALPLPAINIRHHSYFTYWNSPPQFSLILGPLIYFYVLKKTRPEYSFRQRDLIHFSPLFLELVVWFLQTKQNTLAVKQLNTVLLSLAFISIIVYLCWSYNLVKTFRRWLKFNADGQDKYQLRWLRHLLVVFGITWLLWMSFIAISYFFYHQPGISFYYSLFIVLGMVVTAMGASTILRPVLNMPANVSLGLPTELAQRGDWLRKAVETGLHYQDPDLSLNSLAKAVGVHAHELSRIINLAIGKNFNDLINEYRILDVKRKMQDPAYDRITLFGIAQLAGFNSKSTFNRAFRQMTGKSASEYKSELKKVRPNYKLRPEPRFAPVISHQQTTPKWYDDKLNRNFMFKNYLKITWRNLVRNKAHTFINIAGLSVGVVCSLLIMLWVQNELSTDAFYKNSSRLFAVYERQYSDHKVRGNYNTPGPTAAEMKKVIPGVELATPFGFTQQNTFQAGEKKLKLEGNSAGEDYFKMFGYPLLEGNAQTALTGPVAVAISRKMAEIFYGSAHQAIGKTIRFNNSKDLKVSAVFENLPDNVSDKFEYLTSWELFLQDQDWAKEWGNNGPNTYLLLRPDANPAAIEKRIAHFLDTYSGVNRKTSPFIIDFGLQRYDERYLHGKFDERGNIAGGRIEYVKLFSIVAIFILLIACINFMNLTTARSVKRAREIGVRKVVGALRSSLIGQFISESLLITIAAVSISLLLLILILPLFNQITQKQIELPFRDTLFWLKLAAITLVTGLVSGSYPALFLSSFNPVRVLKGALTLSSGTTIFRKGLVVFQFVLSVVMVTGTIVISKQMNYIQSKNLGYDRENLVYIPIEGDLTAKYEVFKQEAARIPGVQMVTHISDNPTNIQMGTRGVSWTGKNPKEQIRFVTAAVGYDFIKTMKLTMVVGRDFSKDFPTDSAGYIINEAALKRIGYPDPIGQPITMWDKPGKIIGVVKDFHFNSLHQLIEPLIIRSGVTDIYGRFLVRTQPGKTREVMAGLEKICKELNPSFPFTYYFADEEYTKLYQSEQIVGKLSDAFSFLAIFISCLGLLGLAMFTAEQRVKEIGIRKVLGATIMSLFTLLSSEFLVLVIIALLIASPIALYAMTKWLQGFEYRTGIQWWVFGLSGGLIVLIALATVSFQAIKAALVNPIKSLRSE